MAGHANLGLVRTVVAVQRQLLVAVVTVRDVDHLSTCDRACTIDAEVLNNIAYRDPLDRAVDINRRMTIDRDSSGANGISWQWNSSRDAEHSQGCLLPG